MRLDSRDLRLLRTIADYRIMTIRQIAMVQEHDFKGVHRRTLDLAQMRFLAEGTRATASRVGRPEKVVSITREGSPPCLKRILCSWMRRSRHNS
jgi:predicted transcriptional regulator